MLLFFCLEFTVLQEVPIEESKQDSQTLALLFGIWFIEYIGKHEVVFDGERASFEVISVTHYQGESDILNYQ